MYLYQLSDPCQTSLKVADPRRTVAGLHLYLTRTVISRKPTLSAFFTELHLICSLLRISTAVQQVSSFVGATTLLPEVLPRCIALRISCHHWKNFTKTDSHGFIRIEARASLEESSRLFLVHVV